MLAFQSGSPGSEPSFAQSFHGWQMNQRDAAEQQTDPACPYLFGVDGRETTCIRRFPGFKRLDYDTREFSDALTFFSIENAQHVTDYRSMMIARPGGDHVTAFFVGDWSVSGGSGEINLYYRRVGDVSRAAHVKAQLDTLPPSSELVLALTSDGRIPTIGAVAIGKLLFVCHETAVHPQVFVFAREDAEGAPNTYTLTYKKAGAMDWDWSVDSISGYDYLVPNDLGPSSVSGDVLLVTHDSATRPYITHNAEAEEALYIDTAITLVSAVNYAGGTPRTEAGWEFVAHNLEGIYYNSTSGRIYWVTWGSISTNAQVNSVLYDGTGFITHDATTMVSVGDVGRPVVYNATTDEVFYAHGRLIVEANAPATRITLANASAAITALVADADNDYLYWIDDQNNTVGRCDMSTGLNETTVWTAGAGLNIYGLAHDPDQGIFLVSDNTGSKIWQITEAGGAPREWATGLDESPYAISLDLTNGVLLVGGFDTVFKIPHPGGPEAFNNAPHTVDSKLKARYRFVNKTTGFVGPMSDPVDLNLSNEDDRLHYATGHIHIGGSAPGTDEGPIIDGVMFLYGGNGGLWLAAGTPNLRILSLANAINNYRDTNGKYPRVTATANIVDPQVELVATVPGAPGDGIIVQYSEVFFGGTKATNSKYEIDSVFLRGGEQGVAKRRQLAWGKLTTAELPDVLVRALGPSDESEWHTSQIHKVFLQVFCTQSTSVASPAHGLGEYFLDHEVPLTKLADAATGSLPVEHDVGTAPPATGGFSGVPQLSNEELAVRERYNPLTDQPGSIAVTPAFGEVDGLLLHLEGTGVEDEGTEANLSKWDIRCSPPSKFFPPWLEAVSNRVLHRVKPKTGFTPDFLDVGGLSYYVSAARMIRMQRFYDRVAFNPVQDGLGPVDREAICAANDSLFFMSESDLIQMNANTTQWSAVLLARRIINSRWRKWVRAGRIICGYDPQLNAVFFSFRSYDTDTQTYDRGEALILWLSTGRITMLYDFYCAGMATGTHPVTGKRHLFILLPSGQIVYPEDEDTWPSGRRGTMVGINGYVPPDVNRTQTVGSVQISNYGSLSGGDVVNINGTDFTYNGNWDIAVSAAAAILTLKTAVDAAGVVVSATADGDTLDLSLSGLGISDDDAVLSTTNETAITITAFVTSGSEVQDRSAEFWGGVTNGTITGLAGDIITDSACSIDGKGTFDLAGKYTPSTSGSDPEGQEFSGADILNFARVYFFRTVTMADNSTRRALVLDARIISNTSGTFTIHGTDKVWHTNPATGSAFSALAEDDQYSISPVVLQVVGSPLRVMRGATEYLTQQLTANNLWYSAGGFEGYLADGATTYPASGDLQGTMFLGMTTPADLEGMVVGQPFVPARTAARVRNPLGPSRNTHDTAVGVSLKGNCLMPMLTNYGAGYIFELYALYARASHDRDTSPGLSGA